MTTMPSTPRIRELAARVGFTEGPVWDGSRLFVTSISRGKLYEVPLDGSEPHEAFDLGGGPNGAAAATDGSVWVAQNGGHIITSLPEPVVPPGIQRCANGTVSYVATEGLQAPNDLAFAPDGALWFTDPHARLDRGTPKPGRLWRLPPGAATPELMLDDRPHPNGLAFSADGSTLYLVETIPRHIVAFPVGSGGALGAPEVVVRFDGEPDGMAVDSQGGLYVACHNQDDALMICEPDGAIRRRIALEGMFPTNVCFAGDDLMTIVVTAPKGGRVIAIETDVPGLAIP
jgi:gluconolactonase